MPMFGLPFSTAVVEDPKIFIWSADFLISSKRGQVDTFKVSAVTDDGQILHDITEIELWRDTAKVPLLSSSDWFCDVITVHDNTLSRSTPFPVQRWVQPNYRYHFPAFDTFLPQDDPHPGQRTHDLDYKRNAYKYKQGDPLFPGLVRDIVVFTNYKRSFYPKRSCTQHQNMNASETILLAEVNLPVMFRSNSGCWEICLQ